MFLGAHSKLPQSYIKSVAVSGSALRVLQSVACNYLNSSNPTFDIHCEAVKPFSGQDCVINTQGNT